MLERLPENPRRLLTMSLVAVVALTAGSFLHKGTVRGDVSLRPLPSILPSPFPSPIATPIVRVVVFPSPVLVSHPVALPFTPRVSTAAPSPLSSPYKSLTVQPSPTPHRPFHWGVTIKTFPFADNNETLLAKQFQLAKQLGVDTVRVDYSMANKQSDYWVTHAAHDKGLELVFIIPFNEDDIFSDSNLYNHTYDSIYQVVKQNKGSVAVWQLGNEVASVALKQNGNYTGIERSDYDETRYRAVSTWLKAATQAVHDADPQAKRLVTDDWVHTGFFDRFLKESGTFDILGWDWYSNEGDDMNSVRVDDRLTSYRLMTHLRGYNKEIWLTEVSLDLGSHDDREKAQADFIEHMARQAYPTSAITGFIVYDLIQDQTAPAKLRDFGIVTVDAESRTITGLKEAYWRYRAIINGKIDVTH